MVTVRRIEAKEGWRLRLRFSDGTEGEANLEGQWERGPIFAPLQDPAFFQRVRVSRTLGTVAWPNGADIAPETLYERVHGYLPDEEKPTSQARETFRLAVEEAQQELRRLPA